MKGEVGRGGGGGVKCLPFPEKSTLKKPSLDRVKIEFAIYANSNMLHSMVMLICRVLVRKYPLWPNFVQKVKSES